MIRENKEKKERENRKRALWVELLSLSGKAFFLFLSLFSL
jgi:hypothetical protein